MYYMYFWQAGLNGMFKLIEAIISKSHTEECKNSVLFIGGVMGIMKNADV